MTMETRIRSYDVAIAGAGPAGSSLAIRLAKAGLSVLLVEQKAFPREKLCGEFISPECLAHFEELGVMDEMIDAGGTNLNETIFFARNGRSVSVNSEWFGDFGRSALGLSRAEMDTKLIERAKKSGVTVLTETNVTGLIIENKRVVGLKIKEKNQANESVFSNLCVDATGRTRSLARRLDDKDVSKRPAELVAFKTHLRGVNLTAGACEIYVYRGGYGGCNRVEDDLYNLCFIAAADDTKRLSSDPERVMREVVFTNQRAKIAMLNSKVAKPWLAVPIERFGRGQLVSAEGLITVGDAAAFIDPFTGSGMLLALESGKIAASSIVQTFSDSFSGGFSFANLATNYKRVYSVAFDRRLRACSMLRYAAFSPILAETTIALLKLNENLRRRVARSTRFNAGAIT